MTRIESPVSTDAPHLLDWEGAARYLNTTVRHVRELHARRELPHAKIGRLVRFSPELLDAYIKARTVSAP